MFSSRSRYFRNSTGFKNEQSERGANARTVHRFLNQIFGQNAKRVIRALGRRRRLVCILVNDALDAAKLSPAMKRFLKIFPDQSGGPPHYRRVPRPAGAGEVRPPSW